MGTRRPEDKSKNKLWSVLFSRRSLALLSGLLLLWLALRPVREARLEAPAEAERTAEVSAETDETSLPARKEQAADASEEEDKERPAAFDYAAVPEFMGQAAVEINGGVPCFGGELLQMRGELYAELDSLGRCGTAIAMLGKETMPTEPRGQIGSIRPAGWQMDKYEWIEGRFLYNRCHLIGWQLSGENDNARNLMTGTRFLNVQGMEPYENAVAAYIRETGNHVLYRATPVFIGDELVARGILLEAQSVEDDALSFYVFCYNVQPDVVIDYASGESHSAQASGSIVTPLEFSDEREEARQDVTRAASSETVQEGAAEAQSGVPRENAEEKAAESTVPQGTVYVGNANSKRFHRAECSSVADMAQHNRVPFDASVTREEIMAEGYRPCKKCNP